MGYQNRQPPEGINTSDGPWGRELLLRLALVGALVALTLWLLLWAIAHLARWTPFSWETRLVQNWRQTTAPDPKAEYLQRLTDQLALAGGLPHDIQLHLSHRPEPVVNAFASLGGNIVVFQGLIDELAHEQALAFVLAHETAHIALRHPIQVLARQMGVSLTLALVFGQSDLATLAGASGNIMLLNYSREFERAADAWALQALARHYGHIAGSDALFTALARAPSDHLPAWLGTHPDINERLTRRLALAAAEHWETNGTLTPLPEWLKDDSEPTSESR